MTNNVKETIFGFVRDKNIHKVLKLLWETCHNSISVMTILMNIKITRFIKSNDAHI